MLLGNCYKLKVANLTYLLIIRNKTFQQKISCLRMGNQGCQLCDNAQNSNQLRSKDIDPALLKPIEFSDQGSECLSNRKKQNENGDENQNQNGKEDKKQGSTLSAIAIEDITTKLKKTEVNYGLSPTKEQLGELQIQSRHDQQQGVPQQSATQIKVPFTVIKLLINPKILDQFRNKDKQFQKNYGTPKCHSYHTWRLQSNGAYTNKLANGTVIIVTEKVLYKGWTKIQEYVPENLGLLIDEKGCYEGNFQQGKAHGKGTYLTLDHKFKSSGHWYNGQLKKGKIQCQLYVYEGELKNNKPHGKGFLTFKGQKDKNKMPFTYNGDFVNGKFEGSGKYECSTYIYDGKFREGKKYGFGVLIHRQVTRQKKKKKDSITEGVRRQGIWQNDKLKSQQK